MLILSIDIKNLKKFIEYIRISGYNVIEDVHSVLEDSSELLTMYILDKLYNIVAILLVHYIDSHYAFLVDLPQGANDITLLMNLLNINKSKDFWQTPVEPLIAIIFNEDVVRIINRYNDEYPLNSVKYVNIYRSTSKNINLLKSLIDNLISIAKSISKNYKVVGSDN